MTGSKHIGIVANAAFNIYNFRLGLIRALLKQGYKVTAIAPADEYVPLLQKNGIDFIELKHLSRKGTNPLNDLRLLNELRTIYSANSIDIALQYTIKPNIYGTLAARFSGTKTVCTVTGLGYTFLNKSKASTAAKLLYRLAFSFADKVLFQNSDDMNVFLENRLVSSAKSQVINGSGIDTDRFSPDFCTEKNQDDNVHFLMIGRLLKDKGVYEYIEAAKNVRAANHKAVFHVLGDIDHNNPAAIQQQELDNWIQQGIVQYSRHTQDIRPYICMADCVILPSYREGMPRVILEAMAMGKPCVTSDAPGCKDAIADGDTGFICRTADALSLQQAMERFIALEENVKINMGFAARKRAEEVYSLPRITVIYMDILRNL
jgi:glycosyltransferase involved in cell wall biosynthesis